MAAVVLQADPPVLALAIGVQLGMHPRDEAGLLLGPQDHIAKVSPAAQAVGAAGACGRVEGVEIPAVAAPDAQQLEAGQHGQRPFRTACPLQQSIAVPLPGAGAKAGISLQLWALLGECKFSV